MAEGLGETIEKHQAFIGIAVLAVAILAYMQGRNGQPQVIDATFAGGGAARGIDPNAAAIEEAAISAGAQNYSTLSSLVGLENTNANSLIASNTQTDASLRASLASTEAGRETSLASTSANLSSSLAATAASLSASLASTEAGRQTSLAATAAGQEIADNQTAAGVTISAGQTAAQLQAAQINADSAQAIAATNAATAAAAIAAQSAQSANTNQTQKDIARASDNTSIVNTIGGDIIKGATAVLSFLGL